MESTEHHENVEETNEHLKLENSETHLTSMTGNTSLNKSVETENIETGINRDELRSVGIYNNESNNEADCSTELQHNGVQICTEEAQHGKKNLKTLELAMVELRPIPMQKDEAPLDQNGDSGNFKDIEQIPKSDAEKSIADSSVTYQPVSQTEPDSISLESHASQDNLTMSNEKLAVEQSDPVIIVSCLPELSVSESLSPPNSNSINQSSGTITSVTGDKEVPIDCPRIAEAVKPHSTKRINTGNVIASPSALLVSPNTQQTKTEILHCQSITLVSKAETCQLSKRNDRGRATKTEKGRSLGPKISNVILSHVNVEETRVKTNVHHNMAQQTVQTRLSTTDRCRSSQRTLSRTSLSNGLNHNENSPKPAITNGRHKCFSPNTGSTRERSQSLPSYERPYGKRELRYALPRKSNFSCHEAAMKEAGFEDDSIAQRKAERLKERLARVASSINPLLGLSSYVSTCCEPAGIEVVITDVNSNTEKQPEADIKDIEAVAAGNLSTNHIASDTVHEPQKLLNTEDSPDNPTKDTGNNIQSLLGAAVGGLETAGPNRRRRPGSAKIEYVECKPLSQYLEYIRDNRHEYVNYVRHQQQQQKMLRKDKAVARLIKMGQAFELRHQGGISRDRKSTLMFSDINDSHATSGDGDSSADVIVMAAKALRPRTGNPGKYAKTRDKSGGGGGRRGTEPQARPLSDDRKSFHADKTTHGSNTAGGAVGSAGHNSKEDEHPKTELEKRKLRAEDWTRSVPTHTLTRAKIQSLRELGADDAELTKWWEAFKDCHYLRQNICHT